MSEEITEDKFNFDAEFQTKISAMLVRDQQFLKRAGHLIKPQYFENAGEAKLVDIALEHFNRYDSAPDKATLITVIKNAVENKKINKNLLEEVKRALIGCFTVDLSNREFVEENVVNFAKRRAVENTILNCGEFLKDGKYEEILKSMQEATQVGINETGQSYNYFEPTRIAERAVKRADEKLGKIAPRGITTGDIRFDEKLYHRGWGRKELTCIMGGAKAGKTTALIHWAKIASLAGYNVLYITLEVAKEIIADRLDASIAGVEMRKIKDEYIKIAQETEAITKRSKVGVLEICENIRTPRELEILLDKYRIQGKNFDDSVRPPITFDMIVVDYADIMKPNYRTNDPIENSKSVYIDLRQIAQDENCAMLTATQTNRDGFKATVARAEHIAEYFNKVRTVDLLISINKTEEEAKNGVARLYFAASRNQESDFTIVIKQNIAMMRFLEKIERIE